MRASSLHAAVIAHASDWRRPPPERLLAHLELPDRGLLPVLPDAAPRPLRPSAAASVPLRRLRDRPSWRDPGRLWVPRCRPRHVGAVERIRSSQGPESAENHRLARPHQPSTQDLTRDLTTCCLSESQRGRGRKHDRLAHELMPGDVADRRVCPHGQTILVALRDRCSRPASADALTNQPATWRSSYNRPRNRGNARLRRGVGDLLSRGRHQGAGDDGRQLIAWCTSDTTIKLTSDTIIKLSNLGTGEKPHDS